MLGHAPAAGRLERVGDELALVRADGVHPERREVLGRDPQTDRVGDGGRAGLELPGDVVPVAASEVDLADHLAAARNGGIASSSSRRAHSAPEPVGPSILWPLNA